MPNFEPPPGAAAIGGTWIEARLKALEGGQGVFEAPRKSLTHAFMGGVDDAPEARDRIDFFELMRWRIPAIGLRGCFGYPPRFPAMSNFRVVLDMATQPAARSRYMQQDIDALSLVARRGLGEFTGSTRRLVISALHDGAAICRGRVRKPGELWDSEQTIPLTEWVPGNFRQIQNWLEFGGKIGPRTAVREPMIYLPEALSPPASQEPAPAGGGAAPVRPGLSQSAKEKLRRQLGTWLGAWSELAPPLPATKQQWFALASAKFGAGLTWNLFEVEWAKAYLPAEFRRPGRR